MNVNNDSDLKCELNFEKKMNRRDFLGISALWTCVAAWAMSLLGLLKFPMPALLPDVSNVFKIGKPQDIPVGTDRVVEDKKVRIVRDEEGIYAVSLICTHLGCIVSKTDTGYSCPCHGSKFTEKGSVIAGPAPKGLIWLEITQLPSGKLAVNAEKPVVPGTKFQV